MNSKNLLLVGIAFLSCVLRLHAQTSSIPANGLRMWLKADVGVTSDSNNHVSAWADESGNGFGAVQTGISNEPTWSANELNGRPVVQFNGTSSYMTLSTALNSGSSLPLTLAIVTSGNSYLQGAFDSAPNQKNVLRFYSNYAELWSQSPFVVLSPPTTGSIISVLAQTSGTGTRQFDVYLNGVEQSGCPATGSSAPVVFSNPQIGRVNNSGAYFSGGIAEVILYNRSLSTAERQQVESYLSAKYKLDSPGAVTATPISSGQVAVSWGASLSGSGVEIQRMSGASGTFSPLVTLTGSMNSFVDQSVVPGNQYSYEVCGLGPLGASTYCLSQGVTVPSGIPSVPTTGLALWLNAASLVASSTSGTMGSVGVWNDLSGNAFNATQPNSAYQPTLVTNSFNGQPVVRFNGTNSYMSFGSLLDTGSALPLTLVIVTRGSNSMQGSFDSAPNQKNVFRFFQNYVELWSQAPYITLSPQSGGSITSVTAQVDSSGERVLAAYVNGVEVGQGIGSTAPVTFSSSQIGRVNNGPFYSGDIAEVLLYDQALSGTTRQMVESYLNAKYGITPPPPTPTGVTVRQLSPSENLITWSGSFSSSPTGYQVWREDANGNWILVGTTSGNCTFLDTSVVGGVGYSYSIISLGVMGNSAGSTPAAASAAGVSTGNLPMSGMQLWLMADGAWMSPLGLWQDYSGNGNNATQTAPNNQPTVTGSTLNAEPVVHFDGSSQQCLSLPDLMSSATSGEIFSVLRVSGSSYASGPWTFGVNAGEWYPYSGAPVGGFGSASQCSEGQPPADLTQFHVYEESSQSGLWQSWLDGMPLCVSGSNTVQFTHTPVIASGTTGSFFSGDIAEVIVYNRVLSTQERAAVVGYLNDKYGLNSPPNASLGKASGDGQSGMSGFFVPYGLTVLVSDSNGNPLCNVPVTYTVSSGSGALETGTSAKATLSTQTLRTSANGQTTACYQLGQSLGSNQIQVTTGSNQVTFTETASQGNLPSPWLQDDVGYTGWAGSGSLLSGTFTLSGVGADIWGGQDSFHYVYQEVSNDQTIIARVAAIPVHPSEWTKAGIMMRDSMDPGAPNVMALVSFSKGVDMQWRSSPLGGANLIQVDGTDSAPYWIKLARGGNSFAAYQSPDGVNWTFIGNCTASIGSTYYLGLALTSHDPSNVALAQFDSVQLVTDSLGIGISDSWQVTYFGHLGVNPNGLAPCGNGLTNLQCYQQGLSPVDFYNGVPPAIIKIAGDGQNGAVNTFLSKPLVASVTGTSGQVLINAPVSVSVAAGGVGISTDLSGTDCKSSLALLTDTNGQISFYCREGSAWNVNSTVNVTAGLSSCAYSATASPEVGFWEFNTHAANITPDSSNTGNTGTVTGGVTWTKGFDYNGGIYLDGSSGTMQVAPAPSMAAGNGPLTINAWVQIPVGLALVSQSQIYPVVTLESGTVDAISLCLRGGGHGLEGRVNTSSGYVQIDGTSTIPADGFWHQVVLVYDGTSKVSVGLDGTVIGTGSNARISSVSSPLLWLGRDGEGNYFRGGIDEVQLWRSMWQTSDVATAFNVDSNNDGIPDWWEWKFLGTLDVDPNAFYPSGDGLTNFQEYYSTTPQMLYYKGIVPLVTKLSGDGQNGVPSAFLSQPLTAQVTDANGNPMANAPVTFDVQAGGGLLASGTSGPKQSWLSTVTGSNGEATAYYYLQGSQFGPTSQIQFAAGGNSCTFTASASPLVAQWDFDDGSGLTATDSSCTGNTCTLSGGVSWSTGFDGNGCVEIDGSTGYLSTVLSPSLALPGSRSSFAVETWFKVPQSLPLSSANQIYPIVTFGNATGDSLALRIRGGGYGIETVLTNGTNSTFVESNLAATAFTDGNWHYIGMAYDGGGNMTVTMDGVTIATQTHLNLPSVNPARVFIGRDAAGDFFNGRIDNTKIRRDLQTVVDFQDQFATSIFTPVESIQGSGFASSSGQWLISGSGVLNSSRRGSVTYNFSIPSDGVWGYQVTAQPVGDVAGLQVSIPVEILIDGTDVGSFSVNSSNGAMIKISGLTQDLHAGPHTFTIVNWNYSGVDYLEVDNVTITRPQGTGGAGNDQADWITEKLQTENTVSPLTPSSYVSPVCIEGAARFPAQTLISSGTVNTGVCNGINGQWFANMPLNGDGSVTTIVST